MKNPNPKPHHHPHHTSISNSCLKFPAPPPFLVAFDSPTQNQLHEPTPDPIQTRDEHEEGERGVIIYESSEEHGLFEELLNVLRIQHQQLQKEPGSKNKKTESRG